MDTMVLDSDSDAVDDDCFFLSQGILMLYITTLACGHPFLK